MQTETQTKEPFLVPTFGIANTDPLDMAHDDFYSWLECIPEERREEWENRYRYQFPKPAQPTPDAVIIDMRHHAFTLELFERIKNEKGEIITGEKFASCTITGAENPKPRKNNNKTILFALPIIR